MRKRRWPVALSALAVLGVGLTVAPGAARAAETTGTVQDTAAGAVFSTGWGLCTTTCGKATDNSYRWSATAGSTVTVRFTGHQVTLLGVKEPWSNIATVRIDGGAAVDVDYYAATQSATSVPVYSSPVLAEGAHTVVLTATSRRNPASSGGSAITFDRADFKAGTVTPPPTSTHASGLPWSDGGYFMHDPAQATAFAAWRGRPVDNITSFTSRETWPALLNTWWAGTVPSTFSATRDDFILSVPLWTDDGSAGTDANWRQLATSFAAVDPDGYVRLGWEMNCCFSKATSAATWTAQFSRAVTLMKSVAPRIRIVFNPVEGVSSNGTVANASTLYVAGKVDVIALDAYDFYPAYNTDANANNHFTKTYGWNWWYDFARSKGLPFALGEFSVYTELAVSGGDNPAYFTYVYNWLAAKNAAAPGSIAFVSLFNESQTYCKCNLYPTTPNPKSGVRYKSLLAALAQSGS